ncbi:hypothetical protein DNTS_012207 [Danionella cerebrum]|uniref:Peptidase M28 domain-containing protein n=1 Tax=Danionella cerebrum TaxID=2873325 RepID=A0A553QZ77_9TELE|nr:hypothetical protein DNTS_012207 [Danionella translucida]
MAGTIDQARMKFSKIVNSRSYSRFNQAQNPDGESSNVEVKLAVDGEMEEEMDGTELARIQPDTYTRASRPEPLNKYRMLIWVGGALMVFLTGLLIGYFFRSKSQSPSCSAAVKDVTVAQHYEPIVPNEDWVDAVNLLNDKLSSTSISRQLSEYSRESLVAGSSKDNELAEKIHNIFNELNMKPWVDDHYVKLPTPSKANLNKVWLGGNEIGTPRGFLAYSKTGRAEGRVVYGYYGELSDLETLEKAVSLNKTVVLMRAGRISLAQKGAVAALIYPDPADFEESFQDTALYGHVHLGSGDPYTPGFPSFNHTQFAPAKKMGGDISDKFRVDYPVYKLDEEGSRVKVEVNNDLVETKIHNVFGVFKGYVDPDRYVVIGAQRDSLTSGYAKSVVGTTLLMELAKAFTELKNAGFKPKRSIVFASWTAGDFGNVGATEWLEGYLESLDRKAFTYISLDGVVTDFTKGQNPQNKSQPPRNLTPMQMDDCAYPFMAFSGIPSVSFSFISSSDSPNYKFFGTDLDDKDKLESVTGQSVVDQALLAAQVAGQMALALVHDHILKLDVTKYSNVIDSHVTNIISHVGELKNKVDLKTLSTVWLKMAKGSYSRAAAKLNEDIKNSDLDDQEMCRIINNRIMKVEHNFLSPYVSLRDVPFRHIFFGDGWQTAVELENYLQDVQQDKASFDLDQVLNKFALLTWTIQGCANDLAGDIWSLDNEI